MLINQDTFKDDILNYGTLFTIQREKLYAWRWQEFTNVVLEIYPEYFLKLYSHEKIRNFHLINLTNVINFKMRDKLRVGLNYETLEHVNSVEFDKIVKKFKNYIKQGGEVEQEIRQSFFTSIPQALLKYL